MTDVRVAINGFGRIGRLAFRQMFVSEGYEVVAINDLTTPSMLAYLLKHDTTHGKWNHEISSNDEKGTMLLYGCFTSRGGLKYDVSVRDGAE